MRRPYLRFTTVLPPFLLIYVASGHFDGYPVDPALERQVTMDVAAASVLIAAVALRWLLPLWKSFGTKPWARRAKLGLDICWMSFSKRPFLLTLDRRVEERIDHRNQPIRTIGNGNVRCPGEYGQL